RWWCPCPSSVRWAGRRLPERPAAPDNPRAARRCRAPAPRGLAGPDRRRLSPRFRACRSPRLHSRSRRAGLLRRRRRARSRRRATRGYSRSVMANALGLIGLLAFIVSVIAVAAAVTWLVVKVSPKRENAE